MQRQTWYEDVLKSGLTLSNWFIQMRKCPFKQAIIVMRKAKLFYDIIAMITNGFVGYKKNGSNFATFFLLSYKVDYFIFCCA